MPSLSKRQMSHTHRQDWTGLLSEARLDASNLLSVRRAAIVASASMGSKILTCESFSEDYCVWSKDKIALDAMVLECQLRFLDCLGAMDHMERTATIFELLDSDAGGHLDVEELAEGLRRMKVAGTLSENVLALAQDTLKKYDVKANGVLDAEEFAPFIDELQELLQCESFLDLCQLLSMRLAFSEDSRAVLDQAIRELLGKNAASPPSSSSSSLSSYNMDDAVFEARMILVFMMLDDNQSNTVYFRDFVKHLFRFSRMKMDTVKRECLLLLEEGQIRTLDYAQFSECILNVVTTLPVGYDANDVLDAITISIARNDVSDDDLDELFVRIGLAGDDSSDDDEDDDIGCDNGGAGTSRPPAAAPDFYFDQVGGMRKVPTGESLSRRSLRVDDQHIASGRMQRLFDLWDDDHNGFIDFAELTLGMRKFNECWADLDSSIAESQKAIKHFDKDQDGKLNRDEFADMLYEFADKADVDVHRLIDFMVVQSALRDKHEDEQAYVNSLKKLQRRSFFNPYSFDGKRKTSLTARFLKGVHKFDEKQNHADDCETITTSVTA